jgi:hypothetical protein
MAINIQEILHPSDSDNIKFEKINYNFDQILANGGGLEGSKGQKGSQGIQGLTGADGATGPQGQKGESGESSSPWAKIEVAGSGANISRTLLKPKPDSDEHTPVIWLGDPAFSNSNNIDGDSTSRSTLNVGRYFEYDAGSIAPYPGTGYISLHHDSTKKLHVTSADDDGTDPARIIFQTSWDGSSNTDDFRIFLNADVVVKQTLKLANNTSNITTYEAGMLRYNPTTKTFQGFVDADGNGAAWTDFCMAPCGVGGGTVGFDDTSDLNVDTDGNLI